MFREDLTLYEFLHSAYMSVKTPNTEEGNHAYTHGKPVVREYTWHQVEKVVVVFVQFDRFERNVSKYWTDSWRKLAFRLPALCVRVMREYRSVWRQRVQTFRDDLFQILNGSLEVWMERML